MRAGARVVVHGAGIHSPAQCCERPITNIGYPLKQSGSMGRGPDRLRSTVLGTTRLSKQQYAWYNRNDGGTTHPVGQRKPNAWGLYDMQGNVWEWVQDWRGPYLLATLIDPQGPATGNAKGYRGGGWGYGPGVLSRGLSQL